MQKVFNSGLNEVLWLAAEFNCQQLTFSEFVFLFGVCTQFFIQNCVFIYISQFQTFNRAHFFSYLFKIFHVIWSADEKKNGIKWVLFFFSFTICKCDFYKKKKIWINCSKLRSIWRCIMLSAQWDRYSGAVYFLNTVFVNTFFLIDLSHIVVAFNEWLEAFSVWFHFFPSERSQNPTAWDHSVCADVWKRWISLHAHIKCGLKKKKKWELLLHLLRCNLCYKVLSMNFPKIYVFFFIRFENAANTFIWCRLPVQMQPQWIQIAISLIYGRMKVVKLTGSMPEIRWFKDMDTNISTFLFAFIRCFSFE